MPILYDAVKLLGELADTSISDYLLLIAEGADEDIALADSLLYAFKRIAHDNNIPPAEKRRINAKVKELENLNPGLKDGWISQ